jgi:hypothetical protein
MTEAEWLIGKDPEDILRWLYGKVSPRRSRLFCVACARQVWHLLESDASRIAVDVAEQFAECRATVTQLTAAWSAADLFGYSPWAASTRKNQPAALVASCTAAPGTPPLSSDAGRYTWDEEKVKAANCAHGSVFYYAKEAGGDERALVALAQDCFGNSIRGLEVEPGWLTSDVLALAHGIYEERAFDRMPILADALQDAGCGYVNILDHCRGPGPHVRGCWVVDLVLGKQ